MFPRPVTHRYTHLKAGKASAPRQLLLRCSTSCIHAVVLTPLPTSLQATPTLAIAGRAYLCPVGITALNKRVYKDERPVIPAILPGMTLFRKHLCMSRYQLRTLY